MPTELSPAEIAAIRARHEAATPGPYEWDVRPDSHSIILESKRSMAPLVMTFARWGMTSAAPEFCVDGNIRHVKEMLLPIPGREHHKWEKRIDHPDAIALEKSWEDRDALLSHADALQAKVARLEGEHRRRRVDDELPPHGALVVAWHDDGFDPSLVVWNEHGEGWEGQNGSFRRRSGFDWWAPIAPEEEE